MSEEQQRIDEAVDKRLDEVYSEINNDRGTVAGIVVLAAVFMLGVLVGSCARGC